MGYITRCDTDRTSDNSDPNVSRRDFLKMAFATAALVAGGATMGTLTGCSGDTANATSDSETTTNQSAGNNATTGANNENADTSAELNTFNSAITAGGFTIDSSEYDKAGDGYTAKVHFVYNGTTYNGTITAGSDLETYVYDFSESIPSSHSSNIPAASLKKLMAALEKDL